jgi:hypothetical protein
MLASVSACTKHLERAMLTTDLTQGIGPPRPAQAPFLDRLASMSEDEALIELHHYAIGLSSGALLSFRLNLGMHASRETNPVRQAAAKWALARMNAVHSGESTQNHLKAARSSV